MQASNNYSKAKSNTIENQDNIILIDTKTQKKYVLEIKNKIFMENNKYLQGLIENI